MFGRYFYFESNGSNENEGNHYVEIQIVDKYGVNKALGRGLLRYSSYNRYAMPPSVVTDGDTNPNNHFDNGQGSQHIVIDLGGIYDISYIKVWRCYGDGRQYKDVFVKVSTDDISYTTVFSSAENGTYSETSTGYQIDLPEAEPTEDIYLSYIESNGEQWINTLVSGGSTSAYEISFNPLGIRVAYEHYFGGSTPTSNPISPKVYQDDGGVGAQNAKGSFVKLSSLNTDIVVKYNEDGTLYCNDVLAGTLSPSGWGDMTWFVCNSPSEDNKSASMRLYYLKMWKDGVLVRNYIPILKDGIAGMLDRVEDKFYPSEGSAQFIAGNVIENPDNELEDEDIKYVINHSSLAAIANEVRRITNTDNLMSVGDMLTKLASVPSQS